MVGPLKSVKAGVNCFWSQISFVQGLGVYGWPGAREKNPSQRPSQRPRGQGLAASILREGLSTPDTSLSAK